MTIHLLLNIFSLIRLGLLASQQSHTETLPHFWIVLLKQSSLGEGICGVSHYRHHSAQELAAELTSCGEELQE